MPSPEPSSRAPARERRAFARSIARDRRLLDVVLAAEPARNHHPRSRRAGSSCTTRPPSGSGAGSSRSRPWPTGSSTGRSIPTARRTSREDWSASRRRARRASVPSEPREHHIQRFDGTFAWVLGELGAAPRRPGRAASGALSVFVDITPLKQLQLETPGAMRSRSTTTSSRGSAPRSMALALGRTEQAEAAIESALDAARKIVNDLLGDAGVEGKLAARADSAGRPRPASDARASGHARRRLGTASRARAHRARGRRQRGRRRGANGPRGGRRGRGATSRTSSCSTSPCPRWTGSRRCPRSGASLRARRSSS